MSPAFSPPMAAAPRFEICLAAISIMARSISPARSPRSMTAIGLKNIQVIMSVTLLLVLVAATVNTLPLKQDRRLRQPGG